MSAVFGQCGGEPRVARSDFPFPLEVDPVGIMKRAGLGPGEARVIRKGAQGPLSGLEES